MHDFDLQKFLPYRLSVLASAISRQLEGVYSEKFGVSVAEWRVLAHLSQEDEISIRELHHRIDLDKAKAVRASQRLEALGLVRRRENEEDRRLIALSLTEKGKKRTAEIIECATGFERDLLSQLSDSELRKLEKTLDRLAEQLKIGDQPVKR